MLPFETEGGAGAWMLFYPPRNGRFSGPEGQKPPLLVRAPARRGAR